MLLAFVTFMLTLAFIGIIVAALLMLMVCFGCLMSDTFDYFVSDTIEWGKELWANWKGTEKVFCFEVTYDVNEKRHYNTCVAPTADDACEFLQKRGATRIVRVCRPRAANAREIQTYHQRTLTRNTA